MENEPHQWPDCIKIYNPQKKHTHRPLRQSNKKEDEPFIIN